MSDEQKSLQASAAIPRQYVDTDPDETREWTESLDALIDKHGVHRARQVMFEMLRHASEREVGIPIIRSTDYINTISPADEPEFPGNAEYERRIRAFVRWNAAIMVHRAQRPGVGVGGHISSYASSAALYEVGFNHFFRGQDHPGGGDQVFFQGHASPGMYARAFVEGRISAERMDGFRQELSHANDGGSLPSYPHPRLMPEFWQFPTVSMGLGPLHAIYQARFNRYLHGRGIKDTSDQRVWAFLGDGETDEPESLGAIGLAAREKLDNLTFVINCNLQRLDGPVRGNGKIIQELEATFRGAGWKVIKVVWGSGWDDLLARDVDGALIELMNNTLDGDYQTYRAEDGAFLREHFFGRDPRVAKLVEHLSDDELWALQRGGHDYKKVYAAYKEATETKGQPTVILAKTIKGWKLGPSFQGRNATHQMKKLSLDDLKGFRDELNIPLSDDELDPYLPPYYRPADDDPIMQYLHERRRALGGYVPERRTAAAPLPQPEAKVFEVAERGSGNQPVATTMAFVRLFKDLVRVEGLGARFVPIIPDEARTFGMDSLFSSLRIYSPHGQQYTPVDRELMLSYKESTAGQILHEGINEAGSVASFVAAGSTYSTHGENMVPIYIFYSMFGFQRTGDSFWLAMDQKVRGFVVGATAGRTTLNGEGLQHEDGHSMLIAATNPGVVAYDPAFAFEIGHIMRDGLRRMYGEHPEDIFYYLTVYNEPYAQPAQPENVDVDGILRGMHLYAPAGDGDGARAQILASGVGVNWALEAQRILREEWNVLADVWSVTSWNELRRDGLAADRHNLLHPNAEYRKPYVTEKLEGRPGPVIAVSDWMRAVQEQIREWVPQDFYALGTDGWGMSDTRGALRRHFLVDAQSIVVQTLSALAKQGQFEHHRLQEAVDRYQLHDASAADAGNTEGAG